MIDLNKELGLYYGYCIRYSIQMWQSEWKYEIDKNMFIYLNTRNFTYYFSNDY